MRLLLVVGIGGGCRWIAEVDLNTAYVRERFGPEGPRESIVFCTTEAPVETDDSTTEPALLHEVYLYVDNRIGTGTYEVTGGAARVEYYIQAPVPSAVEQELEFHLDDGSSPQLPGGDFTEMAPPEPCSFSFE